MNDRKMFETLKSIGVLNQDSGDWRELATTEPFVDKLVSYCTSDKCCSYTEKVFCEKTSKFINKRRRKSKILKYVNKGTDDCKDCSNSLLWKTIQVPVG